MTEKETQREVNGTEKVRDRGRNMNRQKQRMNKTSSMDSYEDGDCLFDIYGVEEMHNDDP